MYTKYNPIVNVHYSDLDRSKWIKNIPTSVEASIHLKGSGLLVSPLLYFIDSLTISFLTNVTILWRGIKQDEGCHLVFVRIFLMHFIQSFPNTPNNIHHILHFHFGREILRYGSIQNRRGGWRPAMLLWQTSALLSNPENWSNTNKLSK